MRTFCFLVSSLVLGALCGTPYAIADARHGFAELVSAEASSLIVPAKAKCLVIGNKRICLEKDDGDGGNAKQNDDDDDGDDDDEPKKKTGNICAGEVACPPGYMVLDKPNKYGACCELVEQKATCPADRPVGTPPNCCPEGTQFNKGACYPLTCSPGWEGVPPDCTPPTPVGPTPKKTCPDGSKVDATKPCPGEQYCTTCGGPGCLQNGTPCPFGGVTTCRPIPDKTYYNCCCP